MNLKAVAGGLCFLFLFLSVLVPYSVPPVEVSGKSPAPSASRGSPYAPDVWERQFSLKNYATQINYYGTTALAGWSFTNDYEFFKLSTAGGNPDYQYSLPLQKDGDDFNATIVVKGNCTSSSMGYLFLILSVCGSDGYSSEGTMKEILRLKMFKSSTTWQTDLDMFYYTSHWMIDTSYTSWNNVLVTFNMETLNRSAFHAIAYFDSTVIINETVSVSGTAYSLLSANRVSVRMLNSGSDGYLSTLIYSLQPVNLLSYKYLEDDTFNAATAVAGIDNEVLILYSTTTTASGTDLNKWHNYTYARGLHLFAGLQCVRLQSNIGVQEENFFIYMDNVYAYRVQLRIQPYDANNLYFWTDLYDGSGNYLLSSHNYFAFASIYNMTAGVIVNLYKGSDLTKFIVQAYAFVMWSTIASNVVTQNYYSLGSLEATMSVGGVHLAVKQHLDADAVGTAGRFKAFTTLVVPQSYEDTSSLALKDLDERITMSAGVLTAYVAPQGGNIFIDFLNGLGGGLASVGETLINGFAYLGNQILAGIAAAIFFFTGSGFFDNVGAFMSAVGGAFSGFITFVGTVVTAIPDAVTAFSSFIVNTFSVVGGFFATAISLFATYSVYIGLILLFIIVGAVLDFIHDPSMPTVARIFSPWWSLFRFLFTIIDTIVRTVIHVIQALVNLV